jgi:hypothetical protein
MISGSAKISIQSKQGGMKMITPPMAAVAGLGDHAGGVRIREVSVGAERDDLDQRARVDHLQAELSGKHIITMPHAKGWRTSCGDVVEPGLAAGMVRAGSPG